MVWGHAPSADAKLSQHRKVPYPPALSGNSALSKRPALTEGRLQVLIRSDIISNLHLRRIPLKLALGTQTNHTQQHPLHTRSGHVEVRAGRVAALANAVPVAFVT